MIPKPKTVLEELIGTAVIYGALGLGWYVLCQFAGR